MDTHNLVSLVIPVRDPILSDLVDCIASVKNQTYPNVETVIIFDRHDEEKDRQVLDVVESANIPNLNMIVRDKSNGFTNALNCGISHSHGEYVARLDSDDVCHPDRIKKQKEYIDLKDCSLVGSWARIINKGRVIRLFQPPYLYEDIRYNIMKHNPLVHSSIMFRKHDVQKVGLYNPNFNGSEDYELYLRLLGQGYRIENIPEHLVDIRESQNSILRGSQWRRNRRMYIKAKFAAVTRYHFNKPIDLLYCMLSPLSLLISPQKAMSFKSLTGWYVEPIPIHRQATDRKV